ncbi:MAG: holo-ACP synthase [Elusimicrobia bacterium]|nr:holo-ACP synthase [Elusimicrobiota bacterium]
MRKKFQASIAGIGIDIIEVARIRKIFGKHPASLKRFFTPEETRYCLKSRNKYERIAARFAAKEAVIKALDIKNLRLKDIPVSKAETGRPGVVLAGAGFKNTRIMLSLTHTAAYACAVAVALRMRDEG